MSMEAETGEMIVRVTIDGIERTIRLSGTAAMMTGKLLVFLVAALSRGKAKDIALNPGGMCTVTIPDERKGDFVKLAKKYHLNFFIAKDKLHEEGLCDVCARNEDAAVLNRICEKLDLNILEKSSMRFENTDMKSGEAKSVSAEEMKRQVSEEIDKLSVKGGRANPVRASEQNISRFGAGARDIQKENTPIKSFINKYKEKMKGAALKGKTKAKEVAR